MDGNQVIAHLQSQFSGQLVLYVDDIAKVLGKSDKAISNLIARKGLPFKIKTVGGLRCVDIFQVAQWLSSVEETPENGTRLSDAAPLKLLSKAKKAKPGKSVEPVERGDTKQPLTGLMAAQIIRMRRKFNEPMQRFVFGLRKPEEFAFMHEVQEKLLYSADLLATSYVVTIRKLAPLGYELLCEETIRSFKSEARASDFLMTRLSHARYARRNKHVVHFLLTHAAKTLAHVIIADDKWTLLNNVIGLELPGL